MRTSQSFGLGLRYLLATIATKQLALMILQAGT